MGDLAPLLGYGGGGIALALVAYLFNSMRGLVGAQAERAKDAEERRDQLELQLDEAREGRRKAEDRADMQAREVHGLRNQIQELTAKVERLTQEVARLRAQVGESL